MLILFAAAIFAQPPKGKLDIKKKIADATPASLPQSPTDGRIRTDAQDAGVKGKVKSVTTRDTDNATPGYPKQILIGEDFYDETGNRVRSIEWDNIYPVEVSVFGYVDKMRVRRQGTVKYADGELPVIQTCVPMVNTVPTPPAKYGEERYDIRWVYRYDTQGRLVEEVHFSNTGEMLTRTTYTYESESRRVVLDFIGGVKPIARVIEILDPGHGNVVEEWLHDEEEKVSAIRQYRYKFDERGNWIEQKVTEQRPYDKRQKPVATTYRSLTYYS